MASLNLFYRAKTLNLQSGVQIAATKTTEGFQFRGRCFLREETDGTIKSRSSSGSEAGRLLTLADVTLLAESCESTKSLQSTTDDGGLQTDGDGRLQSAKQPKCQQKLYHRILPVRAHYTKFHLQDQISSHTNDKELHLIMFS